MSVVSSVAHHLVLAPIALPALAAPLVVLLLLRRRSLGLAVSFASSIALIGVALDGDRRLPIRLQPIGLKIEDPLRVRLDVELIEIEEHTVADVGDEILLRTRHDAWRRACGNLGVLFRGPIVFSGPIVGVGRRPRCDASGRCRRRCALTSGVRQFLGRSRAGCHEEQCRD